ncbi:MAG: insulinase family protein [Bacteroidetes bacterium]|jgi:zinc protease|nr:insulinase family protein [Bacteroidota bacterium]MBP9135617.1 insulinase family protein [Chitinophagales bacterium]MBK7138463.1 insulinase family protein [Bacteroidota bacterium]MBK7504447.1 insulinase family protein [Bacteroidota bacterium]MBK7641324.1 insulinase family protein [Bacteroidota bacterium]
MTKRFFMLLIISLPTLGLWAGGQLPSNFFMKKLPNGLEILVIEDASVPLATCEISVHNGSYCEDSAYNGLSHMYEHMFFKANKDYPSQEQFLDRVNELGISFNGTTSNERVNYFITLSNSKVKEGLEFMNSAIRYPKFDTAEMRRENPVVDGEFQRAESNPVYWLGKDFDHAMWGDAYTRKNPIGIHEVIQTCTPYKMNVIKEKYYYPNNAIMSVAGDVNHEEIFKLVESIYGSWESSKFDIFQKYPIPEFEPLKENKTFITVNQNAQIPIMEIGWHGPDTRNDIKATYAADVFSFILGLQTSSFYQNLVESGLALQVGVGYQTCKHTGPITAFLVPNPASLTEAYAAFWEEVAKWDSDDYFTDEQLETAKTQLAISDAFDKEKTSEYLHTVSYWWASADIPYYTSYVENLKKVTRKDIQDYIQKYIKGKNYVAGVLLNPMVKEQMGVNTFEELFK